jgi:UDP-N-acetylmuramate dehydrogenase
VPLVIHDGVPLAPLTTLELGGPARHLTTVPDRETLVEALGWARARGLPVLVLGGGSNLVIGDAGFSGLVVRIASRGVSYADEGAGIVRVEVAAGEPWDELVADAVRRGLTGIECLSGIPGLAGATPIQNVGAYGQEVADVIRSVHVVERDGAAPAELGPAQCRFDYRDSVFKNQPDRWIVIGVTFALRAGATPVMRYRELEQALASLAPAPPTVAGVRDAVLRLRRAKSMVIDAADPNRRSVGSFFTNPILPASDVDPLIARWRRAGLIGAGEAVPQFPAAGERTKLSAAWLIEHAGFAKGFRRGAVGISSRHALALVHYGGGTTAELLALAEQIQDGVEHRLGVRLAREPVVL